MSSRIRLWDKDFNLIYDSNTDSRTIKEFMAAINNIFFTEDFDGNWKTRQSGRLIRNDDGTIERHSGHEYLNFILSASNPAIEGGTNDPLAQ